MAVPVNELPGATADTNALAGNEYYFLPSRMDTAGRRAVAYAAFPWLCSFHNHVNYGRIILRKSAS
jgi:hypothetical protein